METRKPTSGPNPAFLLKQHNAVVDRWGYIVDPSAEIIDIAGADPASVALPNGNKQACRVTVGTIKGFREEWTFKPVFPWINRG